MLHVGRRYIGLLALAISALFVACNSSHNPFGA